MLSTWLFVIIRAGSCSASDQVSNSHAQSTIDWNVPEVRTCRQAILQMRERHTICTSAAF